MALIMNQLTLIQKGKLDMDKYEVFSKSIETEALFTNTGINNE